MEVGDPLIRASGPGVHLDLVAAFEGQKDDLAVCRGKWHSETFLVKGWTKPFSGLWTLYDYVKTDDVDGVPCLEPGANASARQHVHACSASYRTLVELCAGMGGISLGAQAACVNTCLFVDKSELSVEILQTNKGAQVLRGDIMQRCTQRQVHMLSPSFPVLVSSGFPCQPFSRQGNGLALRDSRSEVLKGVLRTAWLMQCSGIILECVSEVTQHPAILRSVEELAEHLGMRVQSTVLDLKDQWISRRKRWWAIVLPQGQHNLQLLPWPVSDRYKAVGEAIQAWPIWAEEEELELQLTQEEQAKFEDPRFGADRRRLDMTQPAPTALHSYGNALVACPCGCRDQGLSEMRLLRDGLRGFAIVSARTGCLRHIHPHELGFLNGVHAAFIFPKSARAALCMIGQIASPIQSLWIFLHIAKWAAAEKGLPTPPEAVKVLEVFKSQLLQQQSRTWIVPAMLSPRTLKVNDAQGAFEVKVSRPVKACDIIEAQAKLHFFDGSCQVCIEGVLLDQEDFIPAHVQVVEIKWRPIARALALPVASSQSLTPPANTEGTEIASSRKRALVGDEGCQVDSGGSLTRVCDPNPCFAAGRTCQVSEHCSPQLPQSQATTAQPGSTFDQSARASPNPCCTAPNPREQPRPSTEAGEVSDPQAHVCNPGISGRAALPNPCASVPNPCRAACQAQPPKAVRVSDAMSTAQDSAVSKSIEVHVLTSSDFASIALPKGLKLGAFLQASERPDIQVRHLVSQVPIGKDEVIEQGSLLDVRELHVVRPQAGLLGDAAIQAAILRLVHSAPPGWFTLAPGAISGLVQALAKHGVRPQGNSEIRRVRSFVGAIEAGGHWACL